MHRWTVFRRARFAGALALLAALGCGGGGGGTGGGTDDLVRGLVLAPGGSLVGPAAEESLAPVAGVNVFLLALDDEGEVVGPPLLQTTTDLGGQFSFPLPPGGFAAHRVLQATAEAAPGPVGAVGAPRLHAPFVASAVVVDPASETVVRHLLEDPALDAPAPAALVASATRIPFFTVDEVRSYLHLLRGLPSSVIRTTIEATVEQINLQMSPAFRDWLVALSAAGQATPPPFLGGTYHVVHHGTELPGSAILLDHTTGTMELSGGNVRISLDAVTVEQNEACGTGPDPCSRSFTAATRSESWTQHGRYVVGEGYRFSVTLDTPIDEWPYVESATGLGFLTQDGQVVCLTFEEGTATGLLVAVQDAPGIAAEDLNGPAWLGEHRRSVPGTVSTSGVWNSPTSAAAQADLTFGAPTVVAQDRTDHVHLQLTCDPHPSLMTCAATGSLVAGTDFGGTGGGGTPYQVLAGRLSVDGIVGWVAPSSRVFVLSEPAPASREVGMGVGVRAGSGLDASVLSGQWTVVGVEDTHGGSTLHYRLVSATLDFDGVLGPRVIGASRGVERRTCATGLLCPSVGITSRNNAFDDFVSVAVTPTGGVTLLAGETTLQGQVSEDGYFLVLVEARTGATDASRSLLVAGRR